MKICVLRCLWAVMAFVCMANSAIAAERLDFDHPIARSSLEKIKNYRGKSGPFQEHIEQIAIARVDLNADGLYEFVVRPPCPAPQSCHYLVFTELNSGVFKVAELQGRALLLGTEMKNGLRTLLLFDNPANDFDYTVYTWHPKRVRYEKAYTP